MISDFNNNIDRIIICTYMMANIGGIMLNDTIGNHPRVSIMSITDLDLNIPQILGRIVRFGTKTSTLQEIFYCTNVSNENELYEKVKIRHEEII
jgi:hypothetical protein